MIRSTSVTRLAIILASMSVIASGAFAQKAASFKQAGNHWSMVMKDMVEFDKVVKAKKWSSVHECAFNVRDDVKMMPAASKALTRGSRAKLDAHTKEISRLAAKLDEAGDAGNGKMVVQLAAKFRMHVNMIPALYPKGALPMKPMGKMPMKKGGAEPGHHGGGH